jgi:tetratricopeptide (TPR) repeat protein
VSVDELLSRLDELGAELKVQDRPERRAWNRLGPTRSGWTTQPYDDQAFELWTNVLRRFPDDLHTVHHLAIMHHARAIDTEQSDQPDRSDADWRQALKYWRRLYEAEEFWEELSERVAATPDPVPQVRQDLAERLLRVHFDIALDGQSPHHRARFHIRLALDSGFPRELVERVRRHAYERSIAGLDAVVWRPSTVEAEVLQPAIDAVLRHLERDDDCVAALQDLLMLLNRLQTGQVQHATGIINQDEMRRALNEIRATVRQCDSYVSRLESLLLGAEEKDEPALSDLVLWHSRAGQACQLTNAFDEAAEYYRRALRAAHAGADPLTEELHSEWLLSTVLAARELAAEDGKRARQRLASIKESERLPGLALVIRAQTWMLLGDLEKADRDADDALSALDSAEDVNHWDDDPAELRAACRELREQIRRARLVQKLTPHMKEAEEAAKSARWSEAVRALNTVLAIDENYVPALVRRAECQMARYETGAAGKDINRAEQLCRSAGDTQSLKVVRQLGNALKPLHRRVLAYGGPKAFRLRQEGIKAANGGDYDKAIDLLRNARAAARAGATKNLDEDLAVCLNAAACKLVEPVARKLRDGTVPSGQSWPDWLSSDDLDESIRDWLSFPSLGRTRLPSLGFLGSQATVRRAEEMLSEAASLHPSPVIEENLSQVALLRGRIEDSW